MLHHDVELIAMDDEQALFIGGHVIGMIGDFDAAENRPDIVARELVVIAGHVNHAGALAHLAQQLLHDIIVGLRPIPTVLEPPAVDHVADEIDRLGIIMFEKIQQKLGLTPARAEMNVGQEKRAVKGRLWSFSGSWLTGITWITP